MSVEILKQPVVKALIQKAAKRSFASRHRIVEAGDIPETLYLILEGSVAVMLEGDEGREIVLAYLGPGDFFGEMCLFPEQKLRTAIIRTRSPTLVAEMGYAEFRNLAHTNPEIMFVVAGQLAARLRDTSRRLSDLAFLDVSGRVARALLDLAQRPDAQAHPRGTIVRVSRQEIARLVGCSREMAGRVVKRLEENGVIASEGRSVTLLGLKPAR